MITCTGYLQRLNIERRNLIFFYGNVVKVGVNKFTQRIPRLVFTRYISKLKTFPFACQLRIILGLKERENFKIFTSFSSEILSNFAYLRCNEKRVEELFIESLIKASIHFFGIISELFF